MEIAYGGRMR